jgi:hypothetical protein
VVAGVRWAKIIARRAITDAYAIADKDERRGAVSLARPGVTAAPTLASTEPQIAVTPNDRDARSRGRSARRPGPVRGGPATALGA